jgi:hypothetical protein
MTPIILLFIFISTVLIFILIISHKKHILEGHVGITSSEDTGTHREDKTTPEDRTTREDTGTDRINREDTATDGINREDTGTDRINREDTGTDEINVEDIVKENNDKKGFVEASKYIEDKTMKNNQKNDNVNNKQEDSHTKGKHMKDNKNQEELEENINRKNYAKEQGSFYDLRGVGRGYPYWAVLSDWYYPHWNQCNKQNVINNCMEHCRQGKHKCSQCFDKYCLTNTI